MAKEVDLPYRRGHWIARTTRPLDHEALLTLVRKIQAAAFDADPSRMQQAAREFCEALDRHLQDEARSLDRVIPAQARILKKGQDRISTLASELLVDTGRGCRSSGRSCESRAQQLLALLSLQAQDERHAWSHRAACGDQMEAPRRWSHYSHPDILRI